MGTVGTSLNGNPIRTILWFMRGLAMLLLVVGLLSGQQVLSESNAIIAAAIVVSFIVEPRLLSRFAGRPGDPAALPPQVPASSKLADAYFVSVVGSMRVIGGLFVAVGLMLGAITVSRWSESMRNFGGTGGTIGAILFLSAFVGLGTLLLLGRHIPLMRALRELGERQRRGR